MMTQLVTVAFWLLAAWALCTLALLVGLVRAALLLVKSQEYNQRLFVNLLEEKGANERLIRGRQPVDRTQVNGFRSHLKS